VILRIAAALALLLGAAVLLVYLQAIGRGPGAPLVARHLREMKERVDPPDSLRAVTAPEMDALPTDWSVAEYSALERRGVSLEGYAQRMLRASDGDLHLEIVATPHTIGGYDTSYVTVEITDRWRRRTPGLDWDRLASLFRPHRGSGTSWTDGPRRVRISGWLLFDVQNAQRPAASPQLRGARLSGWEIHPVTRIERWDDRSGRYEIVAR
jgi:hypothetical protein